MKTRAVRSVPIRVVPLLIAAVVSLARGQVSDACKSAYRVVQQNDGALNNLKMVQERLVDSDEADVANSVGDRLASTLQAVQQYRQADFMSSRADQEKMAKTLDVPWNPQWNNNRAAFLQAMIQAERALAKKDQAEAAALTKQISNDPGLRPPNLIGQIKQASDAQTQANNKFDSLGCDKAAVAADWDIQQEQLLASVNQRIAQLSAKADAFANARAGRYKATLNDAGKQVSASTNAAVQAAQHLESLKNVQNSLPKNTNCSSAEEAQKQISNDLQKAQSLEQTLTTTLKQAEVIKCSDANAAANISVKYNNAIKMLGQIGALEKEAQTANGLIQKVATANAGKTSQQLLETAQGYVDAIDQNVEDAQTAAKKAASDGQAAPFAWRHSDIDATILQNDRALLTLDAEKLQGEPWQQAYAGLTKLKAKLDAIQQQQPADEDQIAGDQKQAAGQADKAAKTAAEAKTVMESLRASLQTCNVKPMDDEVAQFGPLTTSAGIQVSGSASLVAKAKSCAQPAQCQTLTSQLTQLMQKGDLTGAQNLINQASGSGCNVSDLQELFNIDKLALTLHSLANDCRFQDALNLASQVPQKYQSMSIIQDELARVRMGAKTVADVQQLLKQQQAALQKGDNASAAQFLSQAQKEANTDQTWYHCAVSMLTAAPGKTSSTPQVAGLVLTKTDVLPSNFIPFAPYGKPQGGDRTNYTSTSATLDHLHTNTDGSLIEHMTNHFDYSMKFSGTAGVLRPGDIITISINGSDTRQPLQLNKDGTVPGAWGVTGDVHFGGLQQLSGTPCWAGSFSKYHASCTGEFKLQVPPAADKVTISLCGNFGINCFATYTYEKPQ